MLNSALLTKEIIDSLTEKTSNNEILRAESYLYDTVGRRTHSINEKAQVTKYVYDTQGRIETVYYPYSEEKVSLDKQEATETGLFFSMDKGLPQNMYLSAQEKASLSSLLENISYGRSSMLTTMQNVWKESYTYDANSNRITKTTPWGTVAYKYDNENRLVYSGVDGNGTSFSYDANGNLLSKNNTYKSEEYFYNGINRMAQSIVTDNIEKTQVVSNYGYDAFGRRNLVQDVGSSTMRTLYDGFSFDILREAEVFQGGDFTTNFVQSGSINYATNQVSSSRYRYIESENDSDSRYKNDEGYIQTQNRFTGTRTPLYGKGEAVATNRSASISANGRAYFGTDILGSVRSATNEYSTLEDRYEYDIFGTPYEGDFSAGLSNGYTGKPYDTVTGLYNYGYRDYSPQVARFTTVDPIRDGNNWFSYVVNDPVNYVDLWGLSASDASLDLAEVRNGIATPIGENFGNWNISSWWGKRESFQTPNGKTKPGHNGLDFVAPKGTRVNAVKDGTVIYSDPVGDPEGYGSVIVVEHNDGTGSLYAHLEENQVVKGDTVKAGQQIGTVGSTGLSTGPHLHFSYDGNKDGEFSRDEKFDDDDPAKLFFSEGY